MHKRNKRKTGKIVIISLILFLVIFSTVSLIITNNILNQNFKKVDPPETKMGYTYSDIQGYERTLVSFQSGKNKLQGYLYGEQNTKGLVIISHGLGGGAEDYLAEAMYFVDNDWRVLAFDNTGSYLSEGKSTRGLQQSAIDLHNALLYVESEPSLSELQIMLYGHSWGGYATTAVFNYEHKNIKAVASLAGYNTPFEMLFENSKDMMGGFSYAIAPYLWINQKFQFGGDANLSAVDGINKSDIPFMIIHGNADNMISHESSGIIAHKDEITNSNVIYKLCESDRSNGHNNLTASKEAIEYSDILKKERTALFEQYGDEVPLDVIKTANASVDKALIEQLNPDFMGGINAFFTQHLS